MLSLAIKNTILVVVIILIIHFLFKNVIFDMKNTPQATKEGFKENIKDKEDIPKPHEHILPKMSPAPIKRVSFNVEPFTSEKPNPNAEKELFNYLFEEPPMSGTTNSCQESIKMTSVPKESVLKRPVSVNPEEEEYDESERLIIGKYDSEDVMNGGTLMEGISGFEAFSSTYSKL